MNSYMNKTSLSPCDKVLLECAELLAAVKGIIASISTAKSQMTRKLIIADIEEAMVGILATIAKDDAGQFEQMASCYKLDEGKDEFGA